MKRKLFSLEPLEARRLLSTSIYVATNGSDSTGTGSISAPFQTIQEACLNLVAGDTINVEAGTYAGFYVGWNSVQSGTAAAPIVFQPAPGTPAGSVIIDSRCNKVPDVIDVEANCNYITFQGFTFHNDGSIKEAAIRVVSCSHINILNNTVVGMGSWGIYTAFSTNTLIQGNSCSGTINQHGIYVANSPSNVQILYNTCFDNAECGIQINGDGTQGGAGIGTNCLVEGNVCYDNGSIGGATLNFDGLQHSVIENNLLFNNGATGIALFLDDSSGASIDNVVVNNTVIMSPGADTGMKILDGSTGNVVFNNIILGGVLLDAASESGLQMDDNVLSASAGFGNAHSIISTASALFVNAGLNEYQLATGSPAIRLGVASLGGKSAPTNDIAGDSRGPTYDAGAFQSTAVITPPPASQLALIQVPSAATVGVTLSPIIVDVENSQGALISTDNSNVTLSLASGPSGGALGGTLTVAAVGGVATFTGVTVNDAGNYTLTASDGSLTTATTGQITASAAADPPASLSFAQIPSTATVDSAMSPIVVDVLDSNGQLVTTDNSTVSLTIAGGPGLLGGTLSVAAVNGVATFSNVWVTAAGTYAFNAGDGSLTGATSSQIVASLPPVTTPASLSFVQVPSTATVDSAMSALIVDVLDPFGRLVTTDNSTVSLTIAGGPGSLGGTISVAAVNGVATFSNVLVTAAGTYAFNAGDGSLTGATSSQMVASLPPVTTSAAVSFVQVPTTATVDLVLSPVVIDILDPFGRLVTTDDSTVTLSIASGPAGATLGGTLTVAAVNGVATFSDLTVNAAGNYTFVASDGSLTGATSSQVVASLPPVTTSASLTFATTPTSGTAGQVLSPIVVDVLDPFGRLVTTDDSTVTLSIASGSEAATLGGTLTVTAVNGIATFSDISIDASAAGTFTLQAADGSLSSATSGTISAAAPPVQPQLTFTQLPTVVTAGQKLSTPIVVNLDDQFGETLVANHALVGLSIASGPSGAKIYHRWARANNGQAVFSGTWFAKSGDYTLVASAKGLPAISSEMFTVDPGVPVKMIFSHQPIDTGAGADVDVDVALLDRFGNLVSTDDSSAITLSLGSHPASAVLDGTATATTGGGVATFSNLLLEALGMYSLKASCIGLTATASKTFRIS